MARAQTMNKEPLLDWNEFDALIMELRQIADLVHVVSLTLEDAEINALGAINSLMMRIVEELTERQEQRARRAQRGQSNE